MNVKALPMTDLLKECDDIYRTAMIISQRSRQIIDERVTPIDEVEDVEDSLQFTELEIIHDDLDKPMVQALQEYMSGKLDWRESGDEDLKVDE